MLLFISHCNYMTLIMKPFDLYSSENAVSCLHSIVFNRTSALTIMLLHHWKRYYHDCYLLLSTSSSDRSSHILPLVVCSKQVTSLFIYLWSACIDNRTSIWDIQLSAGSKQLRIQVYLEEVVRWFAIVFEGVATEQKRNNLRRDPNSRRRRCGPTLAATVL